MRKSLSFLVLSLALTLSGCSSGTEELLPPVEENLSVDSGGGISLSTLEAAPADYDMGLLQTNLMYTIVPLAVNTGKGSINQIDLTIPTTFEITRPTEKISTTYSSYFITGTSGPGQPLYFKGGTIERQGTKGTFGVFVDLDIGANTFVFQQGGVSKTVTITRKQAGGVAKITEITQDSMFPGVHAGAKAGQELQVSCVAPSGATVTASFGSGSVTLKQVAQAQAGVPALFKGNINIGTNYEADITKNEGPISYALSYNGSSKTYKSTGDLYIAGADSRIALQVESYAGFVYPDTSDLSKFQELLKKGAVDYVRSQDNEYFGLSSGGFIPVGMCNIIEGKVGIKSSIGSVSPSRSGRNEIYTFATSHNGAYQTKLTDTAFSITFYNTSGTPGVNVSQSGFFSSAGVQQSGNNVTYTFTIKNRNAIWGYNVSYDGNSTVLRFLQKPGLSSGSQPLQGVRILVDPGHGGSDNGAMGLAGTMGPVEKDVNLAHAFALRDKLSTLGATVFMTRTDDVYYSLDDRLRDIEACNADLFVSLHHNSIGENVNANTIRGLEVYYHTPGSQTFANTTMKKLVSITGRKERSVQQSYYRVTLLPHSPAVLVELGFMSNPAEYERSTDVAQMNKVAEAIASGIQECLR